MAQLSPPSGLPSFGDRPITVRDVVVVLHGGLVVLTGAVLEPRYPGASAVATGTTGPVLFWAVRRKR
ncbi:hypothetical protein BOQ63_001570 (plasmid) [Streptomyces viridifaciens]|nr:hypothetical protein BOQ63_001570 [Streptomyces viridifaciens]